MREWRHRQFVQSCRVGDQRFLCGRGVLPRYRTQSRHRGWMLRAGYQRCLHRTRFRCSIDSGRHSPSPSQIAHRSSPAESRVCQCDVEFIHLNRVPRRPGRFSNGRDSGERSLQFGVSAALRETGIAFSQAEIALDETTRSSDSDTTHRLGGRSSVLIQRLIASLPSVARASNKSTGGRASSNTKPCSSFASGLLKPGK